MGSSNLQEEVEGPMKNVMRKVLRNLSFQLPFPQKEKFRVMQNLKIM
jgi:hypothetical protein